MIIIPKKEIKFKNYDAIKNLTYKLKHNYFINMGVLNITDSYIITNISLGFHSLLVPKDKLQYLGYAKDYTNTYMVFRDKESIKKYIKNRIASLKLKEDIKKPIITNVTPTFGIVEDWASFTYMDTAVPIPVSAMMNVDEDEYNDEDELDF
jgi:hypothetical protein